MKLSQNDRILAVLRDGQDHEMRDIHRQAGFCRLNSRVSELRKRGHVIECRREGSEYIYRLVTPEPVFACGVDESAGAGDQLQLTDAVAARIRRDMDGTPFGVYALPESQS